MKVVITGRAYSGMHFMAKECKNEGFDVTIMKPDDVQKYSEDHKDHTIVLIMMRAIENENFQNMLKRHGITDPADLDKLRENDGWDILSTLIEDEQSLDIPFVMNIANSFEYKELDDAIENLKGLRLGLDRLGQIIDTAASHKIVGTDDVGNILVYMQDKGDEPVHMNRERFADLLWRDDTGLGLITRQTLVIPEDPTNTIEE